MDGFSQFTERNVDIVFCIDGTGSMRPCIDSVKANAKSFYEKLSEAMAEAKSTISSLRIKLIVFRDYGADTDAMEVSEFFELPTDQADFERALTAIDTHGGGDDPENGFESLYFAMKSDFYTGAKDRQIIVLFTDQDALDLKERASEANYPADMVDMMGLQTMWACAGPVSQSGDFKLRERLKRLVICAPEGTKYAELANVLNRTWYKPTAMDSGLKEIDFSDIIKLIVNSATAI